jgi:hypothetical protein
MNAISCDLLPFCLASFVRTQLELSAYLLVDLTKADERKNMGLAWRPGYNCLPAASLG